jgi:predicted metal-dependent HD superfamily phosphohydrolase
MNQRHRITLHAGKFLTLIREGHWEYVDRVNASGAAVIVAVLYEPRSADNEERSADLARPCIVDCGLGQQLSESVAQLILGTKQHDTSLSADAPLLVDIDLSIFGRPPERFWEYERQIRKEYEWVPKSVFTEKRAEILLHFLSRMAVYSTGHFMEKYERQARLNLTASVESLRSV